MVTVSAEGVPDEPGLEPDAQRILGALGLGDSELSVLLVDDAFIRPLNAEWRGKDVATDVLSFPQEEPPAEPGRFAAPPALLGDVVISVETAGRQAAELGHPLGVELRALLIHGILHLVGFDHETSDDDAARMRAAEDELHRGLGLPRSAGLVGRARPV